MCDVERITARNYEARRAEERYQTATRRVAQDNRRAERCRGISSFAYILLGILMTVLAIAFLAEDVTALCVYGVAALLMLCIGECFGRKAMNGGKNK